MERKALVLDANILIRAVLGCPIWTEDTEHSLLPYGRGSVRPGELVWKYFL
jgi:hypothetical protein